MKIKAAFLVLTASVAIFSYTSMADTEQVHAAKYSKSEIKSVRKFQRNYRLLSKKKYNQTNLYEVTPNFGEPFNPGKLEPAYVNASMNYINYYRSLFGLPSESNPDKDNIDAQIGAASLASVNANIDLHAHGLLGYKRPTYIDKHNWDTAESATLGNINFLENNSSATAGEIVTDLLQDQNNLAGYGNTGHRALLLSAKATHMGIGAAYGNNGVMYSVQNGVFADDILRKPVKSSVTYPSKFVFPYEMVNKSTPWSAYFATKTINGTPKVYIRDLTTKKNYRGNSVHNFKNSYFSDGYSSAITFYPGKTKLVNTHKYQVKIGDYYSYSFRLFREKGRN
ncbi:CAP domain-containing protein [Lactobacillus hamsteri]|uniref:SCP domain-containing protein n=1 Tax=Lactobacillus hamsteri DSM 5661 = JCM 6256 TaxID=1423754 RepID=A0A0R1YM96_9LACO|nr:CAP domain-containing protein [Lactobacillus hamsteri]KRM40332.1 hypothetical protein FC39_GL000688 [Lactobacillus hamsteri DSM 5661 = JCM 6256]